MMKQEHLTIGIPAFERPEYTEQAICSCLDQDYENYKILVSDDSHSDAVEKICSRIHDPRLFYFRNRPSLGLPRNSNALLEQGRDSWMIILANDDLLEKSCLHSVNEVLQKDPNAALVRMRYSMIDDEGKVFRIDHASAFHMSSFEFLSQIFLCPKDGPWMSLSGVAFHAGKLQQAGGFPEFHRGHHMDRAAWAKVAADGDCYFIQEPQARIRSHREEITTLMDPRYDQALKATHQMGRLMDDLLLKLRGRAKNTEDKQLIRLARKRLKDYLRRQTCRCFDEGIMAKIEERTLNSIFDIQSVRKEMESIKAPPFLSFYIYSALLLLPERIRFRIFPWLKEYKFRKWHL